jgi:hypothetical protein
MALGGTGIQPPELIFKFEYGHCDHADKTISRDIEASDGRKY